MTATSHPYGLPSEECVVLVCSFIESLVMTAQTIVPPPAKLVSTTPPPPVPHLPTSPEENAHPAQRLSPPTPRRSLDYVAERANGAVTHVLGEEFGIGVGFDEADLQRQRERIALRFSSKSVPKISILEYLDRYLLYPFYDNTFFMIM